MAFRQGKLLIRKNTLTIHGFEWPSFSTFVCPSLYMFGIVIEWNPIWANTYQNFFRVGEFAGKPMITIGRLQFRAYGYGWTTPGRVGNCIYLGGPLVLTWLKKDIE